MIDHLVLATDDLERTVAAITRAWGVTPTPGGVHVGHGTRNELVAIGEGAYLEIIGPDLDQSDHIGPRPFGVDAGTGDRLAAWCARPASGIEAAGTAALQHDHDIGPVVPMSRRRPDGALLEWRLTFPPEPDDGQRRSVLPFLIDWLDSEHPTIGLRQPVELIELQLHTAQPDRVRAIVDAIGGDRRVMVVAGAEAQLAARLRTPAGEVSLSG